MVREEAIKEAARILLTECKDYDGSLTAVMTLLSEILDISGRVSPEQPRRAIKDITVKNGTKYRVSCEEIIEKSEGVAS
jgi:hypothetical protein